MDSREQLTYDERMKIEFFDTELSDSDARYRAEGETLADLFCDLAVYLDRRAVETTIIPDLSHDGYEVYGVNDAVDLAFLGVAHVHT